MKKKLYLGCGLTHAPEEFRRMIEDLKKQLKDAGFEVFEFAWLNGPRQDVNVYEFDLGQLALADLFVAVCDYPSTGLGMELEFCARMDPCRIPVVAFAKQGVKVSKIVADYLQHHRFHPLVTYETAEDIVSELSSYTQWLKELADAWSRQALEG